LRFSPSAGAGLTAAVAMDGAANDSTTDHEGHNVNMRR
jgi:hypothetical protein